MKSFEKEWKEYNDRLTKYSMSKGMYDWDLFTLLNYVEKIPKNGSYVELGVSDGSSLIAVAKFRPDIECLGVDVNSNSPVNNIITSEGITNAQVTFDDSCNVSKSWDWDIDLLFIDGDHSIPQIFYDTIGWLPRVKKYGYMLYHDYESPGNAKFEVYKLKNVFEDHSKYDLYIPSEKDIISTSMMIVQKLW